MFSGVRGDAHLPRALDHLPGALAGAAVEHALDDFHRPRLAQLVAQRADEREV